MYHPLNSIPRKSRLPSFLWLLAGTIGITAAFRLIGPFKPNIVDFEFAGCQAKAAEIINAWDAVAKYQACFNLGFDYLYMPVYSTTIALACVMGAGVWASKGWNTAGMLLAWGLWLAALLDAIENVGLINQMLHGPSELYAALAAWCATGKFSLILLGLAYAAAALSIYLISKAKPAAS
jgi:hypothetical protein